MTQVAAGWKLIIERGREPGRSYPIGGSSIVLGAAPGGDGIPLSDQEGNSPKRMAARQAQLDAHSGVWSIRDLDSPGGTFVNRRRILPGQTVPLLDGDVIQLGSVHLKLTGFGLEDTHGNPPDIALDSKPSARSHSVETRWPLVIAGGISCRSWDEILPISSQRWSVLRDELVSGLLASKLMELGRADLAPKPSKTDADEGLDAWLKSLPTTHPAKAELEVHPEKIKVVTRAGATTRKSVQVSNVGYGLLKVKARVEPAGVTWVKVVGEWVVSSSIVDSHQAHMEFQAPDSFDSPLRANLVIESEEGTKWVEVTLEPAVAKVDALPEHPDPLFVQGTLSLHRLDRPAQVVTIVAFFVMVRLLLGIGSGMIVNETSPGLAGAMLMCAIVAGIASVGVLSKGAALRDKIYLATGGAGVGAVLATLAIAVTRTIEPLIGGPGLPWATFFWAIIGTVIGILCSSPSPEGDKS